jgi:hypothetical protein
MLKEFAIALAITGLMAAIVAASYWWRASRIAILNSAASISDVPELHILSTQVAFNESFSSQQPGRGVDRDFGCIECHCVGPRRGVKVARA